MSIVFICGDSIDPVGQVSEQAYAYGPGPTYGPPSLILEASESASMIPNGTTRAVWQYNGAYYKMVNKQTAPVATAILQSADGVTWTELDTANRPAFQHCGGYVDLATAKVYCAYVDVASINLINFDLALGTWGSAYGVAGSPSGSGAPAVYLRPGSTLLVVYNNRTVGTPTASAIGVAVYDLGSSAWVATVDAGAGMFALTGWDATKTSATQPQSTGAMDSSGRVHLFFNTASSVFVPVWGNRCFYQAVETDNTLGGFLDFPGQVAPFPAFPYNRQQLEVFSGSPLGQPLIVGSNILLPVSVRNDSIIDRFPLQIPMLYTGAGLSGPVWTLGTDTVDPGVIVDDFIWMQESPVLGSDGTSLYLIYTAQDEDGQNFARIRLCQTTDLTGASGWTGATVFDLQVDAPPGFNFSASQQVEALSLFVGIIAPPVPPSRPRLSYITGVSMGSACDLKPRTKLGLDWSALGRQIQSIMPCDLPELQRPRSGSLFSKNGRIRTTYGPR